MVSVWTTTPQVTLQKPAPAKVSEAAEAVNDKTLVDTAWHMFRGGGGEDNAPTKSSTSVPPKTVKTGVVGIAKDPTNHLVRETESDSETEVGRGRGV